MMTQTAEQLAHKKCVPCDGGIRALSPQEVEAQLQLLSGWELTGGISYRFSAGKTVPPGGYLLVTDDAAYLRSLYPSLDIVGDFGGPKAVRAVGRYLADHHATVSAFYTSNVEQYLFQSDSAWIRYYKSVATLPLDRSSRISTRCSSRRSASARWEPMKPAPPVI